jgi:hypothetical protein
MNGEKVKDYQLVCNEGSRCGKSSCKQVHKSRKQICLLKYETFPLESCNLFFTNLIQNSNDKFS